MIGHGTDDQLQLIWDEAKGLLRGRINESAFRFWFDRTLPLGLEDGAFVVGVPNDFAREWIDKRFAALVAEALGQVLGDTVTVRVVVDERAAALPQAPAAATPVAVVDGARPAGTPAPAPAAAATRAARPQHVAPELNPRYVFERFVEGPHNQYATAVARSVAESPATAYNPVFIYADTGLGKTHLMQAVGPRRSGATTPICRCATSRANVSRTTSSAA